VGDTVGGTVVVTPMGGVVVVVVITEVGGGAAVVEVVVVVVVVAGGRVVVVVVVGGSLTVNLARASSRQVEPLRSRHATTSCPPGAAALGTENRIWKPPSRPTGEVPRSGPFTESQKSSTLPTASKPAPLAVTLSPESPEEVERERVPSQSPAVATDVEISVTVTAAMATRSVLTPALQSLIALFHYKKSSGRLLKYN
jgi:hypothetical protein